MVDLQATNAKLTDRAIRILVTLFPELLRVPAAQLLERAGRDLKTAIVMQRIDVDCRCARTLLKRHDGMLSAVLTAKPIRNS